MGWIKNRPNGKKLACYRGPDGVERSKTFREIEAQRWLASVDVSKSRGEWLDPSLSRVKIDRWGPEWLAAQTQLKPTTRARYEARCPTAPGRASLALCRTTSIARTRGGGSRPTHYEKLRHQ